jgi:DNA-binding NarL/FixJ family response regulator
MPLLIRDNEKTQEFLNNYFIALHFYQSKEQEINLYNNRINKKPVGLLEAYYRHKIIKQLFADGKSYEEIALIFNISIRSVKSYEKASYLIESYEKKL